MTKLKRDETLGHNEPSDVVPLTSTDKEKTLSEEKFLRFATQMVEFEWQHALRKPQISRPAETVSSLEELRRIPALKASPKGKSEEATVSRLNVKRRITTEE